MPEFLAMRVRQVVVAVRMPNAFSVKHPVTTMVNSIKRRAEQYNTQQPLSIEDQNNLLAIHLEIRLNPCLLATVMMQACLDVRRIVIRVKTVIEFAVLIHNISTEVDVTFVAVLIPHLFEGAIVFSLNRTVLVVDTSANTVLWLLLLPSTSAALK